MEAAESLVHEIDDQATYPFEFVVWRVTGFRPEDAPPQPIAGATLRGELTTFVLHCSERMALPADSRPGGALTLVELAGELGVVERTIRRWRVRGLTCHRVRFPDGRSRLGVFRSELARFMDTHPDVVDEARAFTRLDSEQARHAAARVRELVATGLTENLAAKRVAHEVGRSHETVRQLVRRIGGGPRRRTGGADRSARERDFAYRAWRQGVPIERIAERAAAKPDAIRRRIDMARAERLRRARLEWIEFNTFDRPDADLTILGAPSVREGLAPRFEAPEAVTMIEALGAERPPTEAAIVQEDLMLAAYNLLKRTSKRMVDRLERLPDRSDLDRIETQLRWALRLKRRLIEIWLGVSVGRVQQVMQGGLLRRPAEEIRRWLEACCRIVDEAIEGVDPLRRQSARRVIALETDRMVARAEGQRGTDGAGGSGALPRRERAAVRHEVGSIPLPVLFERLAPWQGVVDFARHRRLQAHASGILARRYGWRGECPRTLDELAAEERTTVARVARLLASDERMGER